MTRAEFEKLTDYGDWRTVVWRETFEYKEFEATEVTYTRGRVEQASAAMNYDRYVFIYNGPQGFSGEMYNRIRVKFADIIEVY